MCVPQYVCLHVYGSRDQKIGVDRITFFGSLTRLSNKSGVDWSVNKCVIVWIMQRVWPVRSFDFLGNAENVIEFYNCFHSRFQHTVAIKDVANANLHMCISFWKLVSENGKNTNYRYKSANLNNHSAFFNLWQCCVNLCMYMIGILISHFVLTPSHPVQFRYWYNAENL